MLVVLDKPNEEQLKSLAAAVGKRLLGADIKIDEFGDIVQINLHFEGD